MSYVLDTGRTLNGCMPDGESPEEALRNAQKPKMRAAVQTARAYVRAA